MLDFFSNLGDNLSDWVHTIGSAILAGMYSLIQKFLDAIMMILPTSPFADFIASFEVPLGVKWLNWFIDVPGMLEIFALWLTGYVVFLALSVILRWVKLIGD